MAFSQVPAPVSLPSGYQSDPGIVYLLKNEGRLRFSSLAELFVAPDPVLIKAADVDGDGGAHQPRFGWGRRAGFLRGHRKALLDLERAPITPRRSASCRGAMSFRRWSSSELLDGASMSFRALRLFTSSHPVTFGPRTCLLLPLLRLLRSVGQRRQQAFHHLFVALYLSPEVSRISPRLADLLAARHDRYDELFSGRLRTRTSARVTGYYGTIVDEAGVLANSSSNGATSGNWVTVTQEPNAILMEDLSPTIFLGPQRDSFLEARLAAISGNEAPAPHAGARSSA